MGQRVLIVEDRDSLALALGFLAERLGCDVERLTGDSATLERVAGARPDVILLSAELKGRSGYDLCQAVRADAALSGTKVLILSARCGRIGVEKAFALGADAFLPKPFAVTDLEATLKALIEPEPGREVRHG